MKFLILTISAIFSVFVWSATASASLKNYNITEITWCNGPHTGNDGSTCPSFAHWQGVQIKYLRSISVDSSHTQPFIQLTDSLGASWSKNLLECKSQITEKSGCNYTLIEIDEVTTKLHMYFWTNTYNDMKDVEISFKNDQDIEVYGPGADFFAFKVLSQ